MTDKITENIIGIETKLAFQEHTIEQLNDVLIAQQKQIDKLERKLQMLNHKVEQESQHWQKDYSPVV